MAQAHPTQSANSPQPCRIWPPRPRKANVPNLAFVLVRLGAPLRARGVRVLAIPGVSADSSTFRPPGRGARADESNAAPDSAPCRGPDECGVAPSLLAPGCGDSRHDLEAERVASLG